MNIMRAARLWFTNISWVTTTSHSPDLPTPETNRLWSIIKGKVAAHCYHNNGELNKGIHHHYATNV
jgi:hypothetical protein